MFHLLKLLSLHEIASSQTDQAKRVSRSSDETWYCREYWNGDSRDGQYSNGDGYHYFEMRGDGVVQKAFEYYETDDGEERTTEVPELVGINWFDFFGFEDEELLESVPEHEFAYIESLLKK
jgi:hypothetical protein